jgi:5-methylcytosine-specific restriction protein A
MLNASHLAQVLTDRFEVAISGEAIDESDGKRATFFPAELPSTQGFRVQVLIGWRTVEAVFLPGTFAARLLTSMAGASPDQRATFGAFVRSALKDGAKITFRIDNADLDPLTPSAWPGEWHSLALTMSKGPMLIDGANPDALDDLALTWGSRLLGTVLALMPLEAVEAEVVGQPEGGGQQILVTRYERSPINRAACIEIHGSQCQVCSFDFGRVYGEIGKGFIVVHHIEPVSGIAAGTIVDPAKDLAPVCPNCHAMLHKRNPPFGIDELRSMLVTPC